MKSLLRVSAALRAAAWNSRVELTHAVGIVLISAGVWDIYRPVGMIVLGLFVAGESFLYAAKD